MSVKFENIVNRNISYIAALLVLSSLFYDYNEVHMEFDLLHVGVKLFTILCMIFLPIIFKLSEEWTAYSTTFMVYIHGGFGTVYIDSAYNQSFNQAFILLLILSANKVMKYFLPILALGVVIAIGTLYYGAGFSYVKELSGNPLSNYVHGNIIYAVITLAGYEFLVRRGAIKLQEIGQLASIGLKSSSLLNEATLTHRHEKNVKVRDVLSCIKIIVSGKLEKKSVSSNIIISSVMEKFLERIKDKDICFTHKVIDEKVLVDWQSFEMILGNLVTNSVEYLDQHEQEKELVVSFSYKTLRVINKYSHEADGKELYSAEQNLSLSIVRELISLNKASVRDYVQGDMYITEVEFK